ncbi:hypothetical protein [Geopsychrobacter electrodiphilus]|uniref:hypothetical protein n=1 Tax=Geopsychrobacter electrodiphilus TaxID=225196 RepID=UPI00035FA142|nr:hypothetical protein [Geopsychrobacter electrodiphilus]
MNAVQFSGLVVELNYTLAKISKYLKNNQYVYLRAFDSWTDSYNAVAVRLNADKTLTVPTFRLSPSDYSPSGKSIKKTSVDKFIKTINHQIVRLENKIDELHREAALQLAEPHPLARFFPSDPDGKTLDQPSADKRVVVAGPGTDVGRSVFHQGIQPLLEAQGLGWFRVEASPLDENGLCELCQQLYTCRLAILDLAGQDANVMLTLGLAYGIGKPVILLQPLNEPPLGGGNNPDLLCYADTAEIKTLLGNHLQAMTTASGLNLLRRAECPASGNKQENSL